MEDETDKPLYLDFDEINPFEYFFEKCQDLKKLFGEDFYNLENICEKSLKNKYIMVKGLVQSGKTNFVMCSSYIFFKLGYNVVIVLRDFNADRLQLQFRIESFPIFHEQIRVKVVKKKSKNFENQIFLSLCNDSCLNKTIESLQGKYVLFIDEADSNDSGSETKRNESLQELKENADIILGISATIMDPLIKDLDSIQNLIFLETPKNYRGIRGHISIRYISEEAEFCGKVEDDPFIKDPQLENFILSRSRKSAYHLSGLEIPRICLINIGCVLDPYYYVQDIMARKCEIPMIVYNSLGISFRQGKIKKLKDCPFPYYQDERKIIQYRTSISDFLQFLKENGGVEKYPSIIIFSGYLAGRGISFVSSDYEWHLTDQRLLVSKTCNGMNLIQKIRLCGIYQDTCPLKLYTTQKIASDLICADALQEELILRLQEKSLETQNSLIREELSEILIHKDKIPKRRMWINPENKIKFNKTKVFDGGLPLSLYQINQNGEWGENYEKIENKDHDFSDNETQRLVKMFQKWNKPENQTKISRFMKNVEYRKIYSLNEMEKLCQEYQVELHHLLNYQNNQSRGYGRIFKLTSQGYQLYPELVELAEKIFQS